MNLQNFCSDASSPNNNFILFYSSFSLDQLIVSEIIVQSLFLSLAKKSKVFFKKIDEQRIFHSVFYLNITLIYPF